MCALGRCNNSNKESDGGPAAAQKHFQLGGLQGLDGQLVGEGRASPVLENLTPAAASTAKLDGYHY